MELNKYTLKNMDNNEYYNVIVNITNESHEDIFPKLMSCLLYNDEE